MKLNLTAERNKYIDFKNQKTLFLMKASVLFLVQYD